MNVSLIIACYDSAGDMMRKAAAYVNLSLEGITYKYCQKLKASVARKGTRGSEFTNCYRYPMLTSTTTTNYLKLFDFMSLFVFCLAYKNVDDREGGDRERYLTWLHGVEER